MRNFYATHEIDNNYYFRGGLILNILLTKSDKGKYLDYL